MSNWKNRTTRLVRDGVTVSVMSYLNEFENRWLTLFMVIAEDSLCIPHKGTEWRLANARHDKLVQAAELMGYAVFSEEIDGKKKARSSGNRSEQHERLIVVV